jgi:hypothetical protein
LAGLVPLTAGLGPLEKEKCFIPNFLTGKRANWLNL